MSPEPRGCSLLITGATGMVGGIVLRRALAHPGVSRVTTLGRRATGLDHPHLTEVVHQDFTRFHTDDPGLRGHDAVVYALGAYAGALPRDAFRQVTVDFTRAFARAFRAASPEAAFVFLSGQGADPRERSRIRFARYKGMAENALVSMGFPRLHVFRPGYIHPDTPRKEPNLGYRIMRALYPLARRIHPNVGLGSEALGAAMLAAALDGTPGHDGPILENRDIRKLAAGRGRGRSARQGDSPPP